MAGLSWNKANELVGIEITAVAMAITFPVLFISFCFFKLASWM
jgi:hypothetical protein